MMSWPHQQPATVVEVTLPLPQPAQQPTPSYSAGTGWSDRFRHLESQVYELAAEVRELNEKLNAIQQQQQQQTPVRRRWYQRLTTVETWTDAQ